MSSIIPSPRYSPERRTRMIVAGGLARSGKGTSMADLKLRLEGKGQSVELIDQGLKYRAMGRSAIEFGECLDSLAAVNDFVRSSAAQRATRSILDEALVMEPLAVKTYLYSSEVGIASGKIGKSEVAHNMAARMLRTEMERAVEDGRDVALIDGRAMELHARQFDTEGLAGFVMSWYFKCDSEVGALRSLGWAGRKFEELSDGEKILLATETERIRSRNHSDVTRDHEPSRAPAGAYWLDLTTYDSSELYVPSGREFVIPRMGMAVVDTSYNSIAEMTGPVTEFSMLALAAYGAFSDEPAGVRAA